MNESWLMNRVISTWILRFDLNQIFLCISYLAFWRRSDVINVIMNSAVLKKCPLNIPQIDDVLNRNCWPQHCEKKKQNYIHNGNQFNFYVWIIKKIRWNVICGVINSVSSGLNLYTNSWTRKIWMKFYWNLKNVFSGHNINITTLVNCSTFLLQLKNDFIVINVISSRQWIRTTTN